jgi:hypothetical protein
LLNWPVPLVLKLLPPPAPPVIGAPLGLGRAETDKVVVPPAPLPPPTELLLPTLPVPFVPVPPLPPTTCATATGAPAVATRNMHAKATEHYN